MAKLEHPASVPNPGKSSNSAKVDADAAALWPARSGPARSRPTCSRPTCSRNVTGRAFLGFSGILGLCSSRLVAGALAQSADAATSLLSVPLELGGAWSSSPADAVTRVLKRMREVSLSGVRLLSDRQPDRLRVDNHADGPPAVWLHDDHTKIAWIIVDIGPRDWCKLAYQFGHELGHVLSNSWDASAKPRAPCQWLEEAMVEAFSVRGLGLLAASWEYRPPFAGDAAFSAAIRQYRRNLIERYGRAGGPTPDADIGSWFRASRSALELSGLSEIEGPMIVRILSEMESDKTCVEDLGALNRWPARSGVPLEDYLTLWETSCAEIRASGRLPGRLKNLLRVG